MAHDVFVSYSSRDKTVADMVCARLEQAGIRCWIAPRDIAPGASYTSEVVAGIQTARAVVLIFSENANRSEWVGRELERAAHYGHMILPFRIEDVAPSTDIELIISKSHWLDALTPPIEQHIEHLIETLRVAMKGVTKGSTLSQPAVAGASPAPLLKEDDVGDGNLDDWGRRKGPRTGLWGRIARLFDDR